MHSLHLPNIRYERLLQLTQPPGRRDVSLAGRALTAPLRRANVPLSSRQLSKVQGVTRNTKCDICHNVPERFLSWLSFVASVLPAVCYVCIKDYNDCQYI